MKKITIGGEVFYASEETLKRIPGLKLLDSISDELCVSRDPRVFRHILSWANQGRIYVDKPDDVTYLQLQDDADYYCMLDLAEFLNNRVNLCRSVFIKAKDGKFPCYLDGFRKLEPSNGIIDHIIAGHYPLRNGDTIYVDMDIGPIADILTAPEFSCHISNIHDAARFLGNRFVKSNSSDVRRVGYIYRPKKREPTIPEWIKSFPAESKFGEDLAFHAQ